jgi:hypothetical protein
VIHSGKAGHALQLRVNGGVSAAKYALSCIAYDIPDDHEEALGNLDALLRAKVHRDSI